MLLEASRLLVTSMMVVCDGVIMWPLVDDAGGKIASSKRRKLFRGAGMGCGGPVTGSLGVREECGGAFLGRRGGKSLRNKGRITTMQAQMTPSMDSRLVQRIAMVFL